ncbi:hypothetical protein DV735_g5155, partial [Chaetothyriales sp. CBS 134920]
MRISALPVLLLPSLLPALVACEEQASLASKAAGWLEKAKAFIPSSSTTAEAVVIAEEDVTAAESEPVVRRIVERIQRDNYKQKLGPKATGDEEWLVYLTGGNKTCLGQCGGVDSLWRESVPQLSALPQENLRLGYMNCDEQEVLCTAWQAVPPSIYHFLVPSTNPPDQKTPFRAIFLNHTTTTVDKIVSIPSGSQSGYLETDEYTGALHPFDSSLAKLYLLEPLGQFIWILGNTPSWLIMIVISFASRNFMGRGVPRRPPITPGQQAAQAAPAAAGVVAAAAGAAKGQPSSKGGSKKRR